MSSSGCRPNAFVSSLSAAAAALALACLTVPPGLADITPSTRATSDVELSRRAQEKEALELLNAATQPPQIAPMGATLEGDLVTGPGEAHLLGNPAALCYPPDASYVLSMPPNDDSSSSVIPLGFTFCLYGDTYTSTYVNNNGNVSFLAPYFTYTASGFPDPTFRMVAAFWADVDTRSGLGTVRHKLFANKMVITWDDVGYYNTQGDKRNTFQIAISDGSDPSMGIGNNVCFCYSDMQWTTGSASGGSGGFGGTPATVGANRGNGINFFQIGRFDHAGNDYDGPAGANDGVSWLDNQRICFNACENNIPPIASNFPPADTYLVPCSGLDEEVQFLAPEAGQTVQVSYVDVNNAVGNGLVINVIPGNTARVELDWIPSAAAPGLYRVDFTAMDNYNPTPGVTTRSLFFQVDPCNTPPSCNAGSGGTGSCRQVVISDAFVRDLEQGTVNYSWQGAGVTFSPASGSASTTPGQFIPPTTVTLDASLNPCGATIPIVLLVDDGFGGTSSCPGTVTFNDDEDPVLVGVPADETIECGTALPSPPTVTAVDCDTDIVVNMDETLPSGPDCDRVVVRTWVAVDDCGNSTSASQSIHIVDTTPPVVTADPGAQRCIWPPNHRMVCFSEAAGDFSVQVTDNCIGPVTYELSGVGSSQCDDAPCDEHPGENGDGRTTGDVQVGPGTVCVRAERAGTEPEGRYYTAAVVAVDACGNRSAAVTVINMYVPHDQSPHCR